MVALGKGVLVGRAEELARLVSAVSMPPALVVVEGEAGIGKTRLVTELQAGAGAGPRFVVGGCRAIREPFPLGPVLDAVRGLGGELASARLSPVAGAVRSLLPEIADLLPAQPGPLGDRVAERYRVFRGLVAVLEALSPVTVVLEDLHWADEQTLDFLRYVLGDPPARVSWVVTFREEDIDPAVRSLTGRLPGSLTRARVVLAPLDVPQTGQLAAALVGVDRVSDDFAADLRGRTGGLPFAIEEVMALLRSRGKVTRPGQWPRWSLDELAVPAAVRDHVLDRASLLPAGALPVLEAAAVLQRPATEHLIATVSQLPPAEAVAGLSRSIESGLLVEDGEAVGFRHALAAQAIYDGIPGPRRRQLHSCAADALAALAPPPLGQIAHHLCGAGRSGEWAVAAEHAADQAEALGHDDEAARLLEDLLHHVPPGTEQRGRLAVKLGRAAVQALHFGEGVVGLLWEALEQDLPRAVRGELRLRLAQLLERAGGEIGPQRRLFAEAVDELEGRPELMATAMVGLGIPGVPGVPIAECRRWLRRIQEILPVLGDPALQVSMLGKVAMVLVAIGDRQWRQLTDRIIAQTGGAPRQLAEMAAYQSVGADACYAGHLSVADRLLTAGLEAAVAGESRRHELLVRSALALLDYCRGGWDGLGDRAEVLIDQLADHAPSRAEIEVVAGCLAVARGGDRAARRLEDVVQRLAQQGAFDLLPIPVSAMTRWAVGRGDVARAVTGVHWFLDAIESIPFVVSATRTLPAVTEAMVAGGQVGAAETVVARWDQQLRGLDAPLAPAALRHARGFLHAAMGEPETAANHFVAAAELYQPIGCRYEAAQAQEQAASALVAAGDRDGVSEPLRAALATYQRLGASWDLARAARTARQRGVPVPGRYRGGPRGYGGELSPRERQVAELAADGRSNKEIAAELFLSPDTVKKHLQAVMRKLDVRTRAGLSRRLPDPSPRA